MTTAWVVGSGGLLGSALSRELHERGTRLFAPGHRLRWDDPAALQAQLAAAVAAFARALRPDEDWELYWAAGTGTMASPAEALDGETLALAGLLRALADQRGSMPARGAIALASSAGAIYAGACAELISEDTPPAPTTAYAREKLRQEALLHDFALAHAPTKALAARISTLYGAGQATGKKQGLLAHMARSLLRNQPIQIYVPFDTVRDYIDAGDAAAAIVDTLRSQPADEPWRVKIVASERPVTIAEIIAAFKRVARRNPRIVTSASRLASLYARRVQFRSIVPVPGTRRSPRQIAVGIAQLLMAERSAHMQAARRPALAAPAPAPRDASERLESTHE